MNDALKIFVKSVIGVQIDIDFAAGNQCVDLAKLWVAVLGIAGADAVLSEVIAERPRRIFGNAVNLPPVFLRTMPSLKEVALEDAQAGDIVFYNTGVSVYGHVAVVLSKMDGYIKQVEQNGGPLKNNPPCNISTFRDTFAFKILRPTTIEFKPELLAAVVRRAKVAMADKSVTPRPVPAGPVFTVESTEPKEWQITKPVADCWDLSFTAWDGPNKPKSVKEYKQGETFTSSNKATHRLGGIYYIPDTDSNKSTGFNPVDVGIAEKPKPKTIRDEMRMVVGMKPKAKPDKPKTANSMTHESGLVGLFGLSGIIGMKLGIDPDTLIQATLGLLSASSGSMLAMQLFKQIPMSIIHQYKRLVSILVSIASAVAVVLTNPAFQQLPETWVKYVAVALASVVVTKSIYDSVNKRMK